MKVMTKKAHEFENLDYETELDYGDMNVYMRIKFTSLKKWHAFAELRESPEFRAWMNPKIRDEMDNLSDETGFTFIGWTSHEPKLAHEAVFALEPTLDGSFLHFDAKEESD